MQVAPTTLTVQFKVHFATARRGRKQIVAGEAPVPETPVGRIPRISRVMALAIKFEGLLANGDVTDYADLARLGHVTRARMTQLMNLLALAPDIQEDILFLPPVHAGCDPLMELHVRPIAAEPIWQKQRKKWREVQSRTLS